MLVDGVLNAGREAKGGQWQSLSTSSVAAVERHALWREIISRAFVHFEPMRPDWTGFSGRVERHPLGEIGISHVVAVNHTVHRDRRCIARDGLDHLILVLRLRGHGGIRHLGQDLPFREGDVVVLDTARPYDLILSDRFHDLVLNFPRDSLEPRVRNPERIAGTVLPTDGGMGALVAAHVLELSRQAAALDPEEAAAAASGTLDFIAAAFGAAREVREHARDAIGSAQLARIKRFIEGHLAEPDLTPPRIAQAMGISVRYLHKLFEAEGVTAAAYVLDRRLERCYAALRDPAQLHRQIGDVAFSWGFTDAAHFSRAFRRRFGMSPREARSEAAG